MASDWRTKIGKVQPFVGKMMGGLSGRSNLAAWAVAGTLAYYLWVKPSQDLRKEQQEKAALAALTNSYKYAEAQKSNVQGSDLGERSKSSNEQ
uniref:Uncharacterized protein n=1 Tax=Kalanchoe fedtschenkoi TaxID=63787 RepID=A0A7N0UNQ8_KALFE